MVPSPAPAKLARFRLEFQLELPHPLRQKSSAELLCGSVQLLILAHFLLHFGGQR